MSLISPRVLLDRLVGLGAITELPAGWRSNFFELVFRNRSLGWVHKSFENQLSSKYFSLTPHQVELRGEVTQQDIDQIALDFYHQKLFTGWRDESYPALALDGKREEMFYVERAFAKVFGLVRHSIHVNGIVSEEEGKEIRIWMGKRSNTKSRFPGMLDNMVAGGLPRLMSPLECAVKECWEEASVPPQVSRAGLQLVGSLTRVGLEESDNRFVRLEEIFVFDLKLPKGEFTPVPYDGEVENFLLCTGNEVMLHDANVKPDVLLVVADLMLRRKLVSVNTADEQASYLDLVRAMHPALPHKIIN
ncbi:hypothetical protein BASA81_000564 [Batrachochytrium salamandrivorans]|nr:hypothetical protein BASA81_000564 [Batrachochytrium salamandrivorans]